MIVRVMQTLTKLIAHISIFCYLTVSGVALAHGITGMAMLDDTALSSMSLSPKIEMIEAITTMEDHTAVMVDCHQSSKAMDQAAEGTCQIVCAALSVALTLELPVESPQSIPALHFYQWAAYAINQLASVEPHPPK